MSDYSGVGHRLRAFPFRVAVCIRFGNCNNGAHDGLRARNWNNVATNANWNIGFAVILLRMD